MSHEVFSIVAPVDPTVVRELEQYLDPNGNARTPIPGLPLERIRAVHFASLVVFPGTPMTEAPGWYGRILGDQPRTFTPFPVLVFESCVDGPIDDYLDALVTLGAEALARVFAYCVDPPGADPAALRAFLVRHLRRPHLWHVGNPGLRTEHIEAGAALRDEIDRRLDDVVRKGRSGDPPQEVLAQLRQALHVPPSDRLHWHYVTPPAAGSGPNSWFADPVSRWRSRLWHWLKVVPVLLVLAGALVTPIAVWYARGTRATLVVLAGAAATVLLVWRWLEGRHPPAIVRPVDLQRLKELEDFGVQNHMTSLVLLKGGWLRRLSIRAVLGVFNLFYRTFFTDITPGRIMGLATIHFAQWTIVPLHVFDDRGQVTSREGLMFLSNYDGSWDAYLDDFVDMLKTGVIAIWSHAAGFPSPVDAKIFKDWARTCMSPWHYWYRRYPELTVVTIEANDAIRRGLLAPSPEPHEARLWLSRFGSVKAGHEDLPEPRSTLETRDIQGLVLNGYRHLTEAAYVLLHIDDAAEVRRWLTHLASKVGDARPLERSELARERVRVNVAFTWSGLRALGLPKEVLEGFPLVFREGMAPAGLTHRSRSLGDMGPSAPVHWQWGAPGQRSVDVLLTIFARDHEALTAHLQSHVAPLVDRTGATELCRLYSHLPPKGEPIREPFGFADGISQPVIEGSVAAQKEAADAPLHLVKPGEFLLGYTDRLGALTPGVPIAASRDPLGLLPTDASGDGDLRDLGRNGSFLVVRQLQQNVEAFEQQLETAASPEAVAARLVGRWRDGTPLIRSASTSRGNNDFTYGADPHGFDCPVGAHIRRANPRDSLLPDPAAALTLANRHRLLRRGRPYRHSNPPGTSQAGRGDSRDEGMVFLCFNSDIERQFEFVQQNWIANPTFAGLHAENDPLLGDMGRFTVQHPTLRDRFDFSTASRFVTVKGGAYFFMPGLSALRYLANLGAAAPAGLQAPALLPPPRTAVAPHSRPPAARRVLEWLAASLPVITLAWAIRFPVAVAALLVLLAWAPDLAPSLGATLFLADKVGLTIVSALASLTAFVVMVTIRLVLLYGWRNGLGHPRWVSRARWPHVLAFQALALPLILTSLHRCALDVVGEAWTGAYWRVVLDLAPAAVLGIGTAFALIGVATGVQSLQAAARPDLFVPRHPLFRVAARAGRRPRMRALSRALARLGEWCVDAVPESLGLGYIDYRHRRILPGHLFAGVLGVIVLAGYLVGYVALNPAWGNAAAQVPPIAYIVFVLMLAGWWLSAAAFFLDRYRVPALVVLAAWLALIASAARTDHFFSVGATMRDEPLSPAQAVERAAHRHPDRDIIIVTAEGLGLVSSAWTAEVLTRLTDEFGPAFSGSVRLASVSSGAALGTAFFVAEFGPDGFPSGEAVSERVRRRARTPGSGDGAWGLVYPDLMRTLVPLLVPRRADRGWAMEQAWRRAFDGANPTLGDWRHDVREGWRPATAFGVTVVETGGRAVLATYDSPMPSPDLTAGRDLPIVTAARLSAAFPYVSPMPRADVPGPAPRYHVADGGYWDNFGTVEAVEWLRHARDAIGSRRVLVLEILSSPARIPPPPEDRAWTLDLVGPLRAMFETRLDAQRTRNETDLALLARSWGPRLQRVQFSLSEEMAPLTWNLGALDIRRIEQAMTSPANTRARGLVGAFLEAR